MKKNLLFLCLLLIGAATSAQTLYTNAVETGSRFTPGLTQSGNPKVAFDDVLIPSATVAGSDSIRVTKLKVGIRRLANAPATNVSVYYSNVEDTATLFNNVLKIPPVLVGTAALPANGATAVTTIVSFGDSIATLFSLKTDTGNLYTGFHTMFVGIGLSNANADNGIRITSPVSPNDNVMWIYNADSTVRRYATAFAGGTPAATFYVQVFGRTTTTFPVTLTDFKGERKGNTNALSWTTATEANNSGFELQRSADGINFSKLAFVASKAATGNSSAALTYSFDDVKPLMSNGYYRLKQIDKDGKSTLSNIVLIKGNRVSVLTVSTIYPNPVTNNINLIVTTTASQSVTISILDLTGKTISTKTQTAITGDNTIQVNTANLTTGSYLLKATNSKGETSVQKFIKQ
jgi:hypothetical protein